MFQSLRQNNQIYILHKDKPELETGSIISVSIPAPKWPNQPLFGTNQEMVVDILAKVNGQDVTYQKIPANLDIADFGNGGIVLSDNKEAMNSEIMSLKQKSLDLINSVDYHKEVVENCDKLLTSLNPEFAERQQQQDEIKALKEQVALMANSISSLIAEFKSESKNQ